MPEQEAVQSRRFAKLAECYQKPNAKNAHWATPGRYVSSPTKEAFAPSYVVGTSDPGRVVRWRRPQDGTI